MLNLTVCRLEHGNAKSFPNLGQVLLGAGEKEPMIEISFELLPVAFQNSGGVSRGIGGDAQKEKSSIFFSRKLRSIPANLAVRSGQTSGQVVKTKVASTIF